MKINRWIAALGAAALLAPMSLPVQAQRQLPGSGQPTTTTRRPRMGGMGSFGRPSMAQGQIVGNKNTKVYHMPGDRGNMPSAKNAVYFRTEQEAIAAGYRMAGSRKSGTTGKTRTRTTRTRGMMGGTRTMNGGSRMGGSSTTTGGSRMGGSGTTTGRGRMGGSSTTTGGGTNGNLPK